MVKDREGRELPSADEDELCLTRKDMEGMRHAISHDLLAPLRRIIGLGQILEEEHSSGLNETGRIYLGLIHFEASRMNQMMTGLLSWYQIVSCELHPRDIDLSEMVGSVIAEEMGRTGAPSIEAKVEPGILVRGDVELVRKVVEELVRNAVVFGREGQTRHIEFGQTVTDKGDALFLKDDGLGFDPLHAGRLFAAFQRLHGKEFPGEGMGLTLAEAAVKRHGGKIWADSIPGQGSTFYFTLP